ncbi:MAG: hypothetical protein H7Z14_01860 [Anaerolineae bacterium]|nr:hypothetical protein [Phycisphaerae bacterium]
MKTQIEIAVVIAMVVVALSHILRPRAWVEFFQMLRARGDPGVFIVALLHLPLGLVIVAFHNHWGGWQTVLTVIGWGWTIKGALYLNSACSGCDGSRWTDVTSLWLPARCC